MDGKVELLTVDEFAKRLKIGRSTVNSWMHTGKLQPGEHFIRIGKTIRFPWGSTLIENLLVESVPAIPPKSDLAPTGTKADTSGAINLDY